MPFSTVSRQSGDMARSITSASFAVRLTGRPCGPTSFLRGPNRLVTSNSRNDWPAVKVTRAAEAIAIVAKNPRRLTWGFGSSVLSIHAKIRPVTPAFCRSPGEATQLILDLELRVGVDLVDHEGAVRVVAVLLAPVLRDDRQLHADVDRERADDHERQRVVRLAEREGEQLVPLVGVQQSDRDLHERCRDEQCDRRPLEQVPETAHRRRQEQLGEHRVQLREEQREAQDAGGDVDALAHLVQPDSAGWGTPSRAADPG